MNPDTAITISPASRCGKNSSTLPAPRMPRALMALGVALCGTMAASAQSLPAWSTVDDVENGAQSGIATDRSGNVFVAGGVNNESGGSYGCISRSSDRGAKWLSSVHSEVQYYTAIAGATIEIAPATGATQAVLQDQLVASGLQNGRWITRKSLNAGVTWQTVDVFQHASSDSSYRPDSRSVAIDSSGNIFVVGKAVKTTVVRNKASSFSYWLVRKIGKDATAENEVGKTTMDLFETGKGGGSGATGITCVGNNIFVAGESGDRWQVRKNTGGGASWELVDDFRYSPDHKSEANAISADNSGILYVVGIGCRAVGKTTPSYWIVRKGTGIGTSSFQTVDRYERGTNGNGSAYANAVVVDAQGNVNVTGGAGEWITRRLQAGSTTWTTTDHFFLNTAYGSAGYSIAADRDGNVFAGGLGYDGIGWHDWVVRRQLAPVPPLVP